MRSAQRRVALTAASSIKVRPVRWLWEGRAALGALTLCAGREGIGKSTVAYTLAAAVTRGDLDGHHRGTPKSVLVAATEDSWSMTIVPRLMAAGADLARVFRIDVHTHDRDVPGLSLPKDIAALEGHIREQEVALILLDPLMSRLDGALDTHKDSEVRRALEPLTNLADRSGAGIIGLIHVNKGYSNDPVNLIMGSRAFTAVARSVVFVMTDPDDQSTRLVGVPKNNLGRTDLPTLTFTVEGCKVADTDEGPVYTGRVVWTGETDRSLQDALTSGGEDNDVRTAVDEAGVWLTDYLTQHGGVADRAEIERQGRTAGHSTSSLKRARSKVKIASSSYGFPRRTAWSLPGTQPNQPAPSPSRFAAAVSVPTDPTGPTGLAAAPLRAALGPAAEESVRLVGPRGEPQPLSAQSVQPAQSDEARPTGTDWWDDLISLLGIDDVPGEERAPLSASRSGRVS